LDETEGDIAYNSAGVNDAFLIGGPVWQPDTGKVGGALAFDGVDDRTFAELCPNPADGPLSVLAWIKDGAPGQVIISQANGANWLGVDPVLGTLMTELKGGGRFGKSLCSDSVIIDSTWHRIVFTWDGSTRRLYVDDVMVADDTQTGLTDCFGGLNIGCGNSMAPGSFWSGLIDDIRIYNRVVYP
jgi:hypothetical protein